MDAYFGAMCCVPFLVTVNLLTLTSARFYNNRVRSTSPSFSEVGFPYSVCGCILEWQSVAYHFWVTVTLTLTSDLIFRMIMSGAYLLHDLRQESKIKCVGVSRNGDVSRTIFESLTLLTVTLWL